MNHPLGLCLLVGLGGFAGSLARFGLGVASQRLGFTAWPAGTLAANLLGCLIMGLLAGLISRGGGISPEIRLALGTGFCGGFTTLSALVFETAGMLRSREYLHAALYAAGTFLAALAAFAAGVAAIRLLFTQGGETWN